MCLATDTPRRSGIQKKKNALNEYHFTDFWHIFDKLSLLTEHPYHVFFFITHFE